MMIIISSNIHVFIHLTLWFVRAETNNNNKNMKTINHNSEFNHHIHSSSWSKWIYTLRYVVLCSVVCVYGACWSYWKSLFFFSHKLMNKFQFIQYIHGPKKNRWKIRDSIRNWYSSDEKKIVVPFHSISLFNSILINNHVYSLIIWWWW